MIAWRTDVFLSRGDIFLSRGDIDLESSDTIFYCRELL